MILLLQTFVCVFFAFRGEQSRSRFLCSIWHKVANLITVLVGFADCHDVDGLVVFVGGVVEGALVEAGEWGEFADVGMLTSNNLLAVVIDQLDFSDDRLIIHLLPSLIHLLTIYLSILLLLILLITQDGRVLHQPSRTTILL